MGSLRDSNYDSKFMDSGETFRRRTPTHRQWRMPRRYVIALMLCVLLIIQEWSVLNASFMLTHAVINEVESATLYPTVANWTLVELDNYFTAITVTDIFVQMPAGLLTFIFSGYKLVGILAYLSAFLHILTPVCLQHHTYALIVVLLAQSISSAPLQIAVISVWKDWAPPLERTKLLLFSFYGQLLGIACSPLYRLMYGFLTKSESFYYAGCFGLVWTLLWFVTISDTPSNDPLITTKELVYLENNIPSDVKEKVKLRDVPWKSILLSKPLWALCLIYVKLACSFLIVTFGGSFFELHLLEYEIASYIFIGFLVSYIILMLVSTFMIDLLNRKFKSHTTLIRKCFICGPFILHAFVMLGVFTSSPIVKTFSFCASYAILSLSLPALVSICLDLSPRYVSIIAGITYTFFSLGSAGFEYYLQETVNYENVHSISSLFLFDGVLTLLVAAVFGYYGSDKEEPWSYLNNTISKSNDYQSYPKPEDEDDLKLVTDNV